MTDWEVAGVALGLASFACVVLALGWWCGRKPTPAPLSPYAQRYVRLPEDLQEMVALGRSECGPYVWQGPQGQVWFVGQAIGNADSPLEAAERIQMHREGLKA